VIQTQGRNAVGFRDRIALETIESSTLASFGAASARSRGRKHREDEDRWRTAHQRDRDRVIHSEAFRRLQHKTQVYVVHEGDFYRTRITHTIEVAQIARTIASQLGANVDLAEAIALMHDLGHPPYGHAGERELDALARGHGLGGFDHNLQCLRIVEELEQRYRDFRGLNLTWEAREGIAKHATPFDTPEAPGEFQGTPQPGVEAQIASIADVLAYVGHDLEDALFCGFLSLQDVAGFGIPLVSRSLDEAAVDLRANVRRTRQGGLTRALLGSLVPAVLEESVRRLEALGAAPTADRVRAHPEEVIALPEAIAADVTKLLGELLRRVYRHPTVEIMCDKGRRVLRELFLHLVEHPGHLPLGVAAGIAAGSSKERVVLDFVASLTDRGALELHETLFDPGSRVLFTLDG
jgi:dGTPase